MIEEIKVYNFKKFKIFAIDKYKDKILDEKFLKNINKFRFCKLENGRSGSTFYKFKDLFIKKVFFKEYETNVLIDYLKQSKKTDFFVPVYALIYFKSKMFVVYKYVPGILFKDALIEINYNELIKIKKKINLECKKLIKEGLLPFDFKLNQILYDKNKKKLYFIDNLISCVYPGRLLVSLKKINYPIDDDLLNLNKQIKTTFYLNLLRSIYKKLFFFNKIKKEEINENNIIVKNSFKKSIRLFLIKLDLDEFSKIHFKTKNIYSNLPLKIKQKIQKSILDDCLKEIDSISNNNKLNKV